MDALIFSDSHGRAELINEVLSRQIKEPDVVIFLGDGLRDLESADTGAAELFSVRGNCDLGEFYESDEELITLGGARILITHGHRYSVKHGYSALCEHAARRGIDIVMFGHTHSPLSLRFSAGERIGDTELKKPLYVFNPGALHDGYFGTLTVLNNNIILNGSRI